MQSFTEPWNIRRAYRSNLRSSSSILRSPGRRKDGLLPRKFQGTSPETELSPPKETRLSSDTGRISTATAVWREIFRPRTRRRLLKSPSRSSIRGIQYLIRAFRRSAKGPGGPASSRYLRAWRGNQWPAEHLIPGFRETYLQYFAEVLELAKALMGFLFWL